MSLEYELEETETNWKPTEEDIVQEMRSKGWPVWDDIRYDHLDEGEADTLRKAVEACRDFSDSFKEERRGQSLIMVAGAVDKDVDRTGYGCGKTTLAKIIYYDNSNVQFVVSQAPGPLWVIPCGKFYDARTIMGLFDAEDFNRVHTLKSLQPLVVIDDIGREGSLKWERRDPDLQLAEKQDRYYSIIDACYESNTSVVITSNMTSRELAAFLGGAAWSRLLQMCPPKYRVNMTGIRDMRPILATGWEF